MFIGHEIYSHLGEADKRIGLFFVYFILAVVFLQFLLNFILSKKTFSQRTASFLRTLFIVISVTSFLVLLECSANYWVKFNKEKNSRLFYQSDLMLFWRPKAGLKQMHFGELDCKTYINSESLRSYFEIPAVKEKDEIRILHLGDSWVFGLGLQDEETYSYLLDKKLKERFPNKKITSINGGTFGYSAAQVFIFLKYRAVKYNPDIIIVKNALNHNVLKAYEKIYPVSYPAFFRGFRDLLWKSQGYHYIRRLIYIGTMRNELSVRQDVNYNDDSYEVAMFQEIISLCKKKGIKLYFLNLEFAKPDIDIPFIENAMSKSAKKNNVPYVELLLDGTLDYKGDRKVETLHPGPNNAKVIAESLFKKLLDSYNW